MWSCYYRYSIVPVLSGLYTPQSFAALTLLNQLILVLLAGPTLPEMLNFTGCPNPSLPHIMGS